MKHLSRRQLLVSAGALGGGLAVAVAAKPSAPDKHEETEPQIQTITGLLSTVPFYVAHRGSGDTWPEHTAEAYGHAVAMGAKAIEVSVQRTLDGVFVCHHDTNTLRMTGTDLEIAAVPYSVLEGLRVDAREWIGQGVPFLGIPKLVDVLDAHAGTTVIFIEDKRGVNGAELLDVLDRYPESTARFVWKQPADNGQFASAQARGYKTWGYFTKELAAELDRYAPSFDYLGVYDYAAASVIRSFLAFNKPVVAWEVHTRSSRDRLLRLGVQGMMCSNLPYVLSEDPTAIPNQTVYGVRPPGDLPDDLQRASQPILRPGTDIIRFRETKAGYRLGSRCPVRSDSFAISFELRWTDAVPAAGEYLAVAFGQEADEVYTTAGGTPIGGYHLLVSTDGSLQLLRRDAGSANSALLASAGGSAPRPNEWLTFKISVNPEAITVTRPDGRGRSLASDDRRYRGGYVTLFRSLAASAGIPNAGVEFRGISIT